MKTQELAEALDAELENEPTLLEQYSIMNFLTKNQEFESVNIMI